MERVSILGILVPLLLGWNCSASSSSVELEGPEFEQQPNPVTYFSNSLGLTLQCIGRGHPPLTTRFLTADGIPITEISGIREISRNNSLNFLPFRKEDFLPSVHDARYRCAIQNPIGTKLSPIFTVQTVLDEPFEVSISSFMEEGEVLDGNPAVLNCDVKPSVYKDFIKIIHWKFVDQYGHETEIESDGKRYQITFTGSLLILSAKYQQLFICVAQNKLNNKIQTSSPFMLKSKAGIGGLPPTSVGKWHRMIFSEIGKNVDLVCLFMGIPSPNVRWEKKVGGKFLPVISTATDPRKGKIWGPVLSFDGVSVHQNGTYRCDAMNGLGTLSLEMDLIVPNVPKVDIQRPTSAVRTGQNVELKCETPEVSSNHAEITWFRNGEGLGGGDDGRIRISSERLSILNMRQEDQGVYQCFLQIGRYHLGASSNLVFPAAEPELIHTFISQTLQPGPSVSLKCSSMGNPIPIISWSVDGIPLSQAEGESQPQDHQPWGTSGNHRYTIRNFVQMNEIVSHVNISSIRLEDSGDWTCKASNLLSSATHSARLNVYGKLFVKEMGQMTFVAGTVALIPCLYGGYPLDNIVWRQNGSEIDTKRNKSRFRILGNGTLQIENIKPGSDKGQFTCTVSNRKGENAAGTASINVLRPPVISSFSFDDNLQEGQRTSISCNVMSGDLPIDIIWLKDNYPLPQSLNVTTMRVKFLSNLIFEEVKGVHSGRYTCKASNAAKTVEFSAYLNVKVGPKWIQEPSDARALLKSDLMIPCHASGTPVPVVKWFRESPTMRMEIRPDHKFQILRTGLQILSVDSKDSANLTCEATNGVGNGILKSITVSVIIPAEVSALTTSVVVAEGLPALLKCQIRGDQPVQVVWRKNSVVMEHSPRVVFQTVLDSHPQSSELSSSVTAELRIEGSERSDSGSYSCEGHNEYGRDEDAIFLTVKARPSPPKDLIVEEIGSRFIRLKWSNAENLSKEPVTHFVLQYKNSSAISWDSGADLSNITVQAPQTQVLLRALSPVTHYQIRGIALNEIGRSLPTEPISVSTLAEAPSGPPRNANATVSANNPRSIQVTWEQPDPLLQNGAILGYHVLVSPVSITSLNGSRVIDEKWGHQTEINELKPNSRYRLSIRAYNSAGLGPESPFIFIATPEGAPDSPPLNLKCEALSPKSLQIQWNPPPFLLANGVIQGYKVIYSSVEADFLGEKPEVKKTINRETVVHGLQPFTKYSIRALAYTQGGESSPSDPVFCRTEEDFPEEPKDIKVLPSGNNAVTVSWLPPRFPNGVITKYKVAWKSEDSGDGVKEKYYVVSGNEDQMMMEVRKLQVNKRYTFWVTASTSLGLGKASEKHEVTAVPKAPAKIASFPVTRRPKMDDSVSLPCRAVGYPLPEKITWLKGSSPHTLNHIMKNGTLFIARAKDHDEGAYLCRAENALGSDEILHEITLSRPPSALSLFLGYVSSNSIQIHWDPPKADPPLTGYVLQFRASSAMMEWSFQKIGPRLNSFAMDNLMCGTSYQIRLAPENAIGLGEFSSPLKTKTSGGPPESPKLTEIIDGNGTMIRVDLTRWPDGGCQIKKFHLEFKSKPSSDFYTVPNAFSSRVFILNTTFGTKYDFRVTLENEAGNISKSFSVESSPQFFTNYDKLMQSVGDQSVLSGGSFLTDPHIIVPIVSAVICTIAVIICIIVGVKRKDSLNERWKLGNSSSQQTWLSSDDFRMEKAVDNKKLEDVPENSGMSIYATLNSRKPIPMTIRDSTVRFQTFGQVENYDAPPPQSTYGRFARNFPDSHSHEELSSHDGFAHKNIRDTFNLQDIRNFRHMSHPNEYAVDEICHEYAHPYQVVPFNRGPIDSDVFVRNTLRKQKAGKRGSRNFEPTD